MLIQLNDVSFSYMAKMTAAKTVLKKVNLSVQEGNFLSIIGPTGSGKSTLLQLLNGLLSPTSGEVLFSGKKIGVDITAHQVRKQVGLVFQFPENQLFEETVFDDVGFGPKNLGLSESELKGSVENALSLVGLDYIQFKDRSPFSLSGGEMRKVAIAGILAMKPKVLVLDEPTSGLDFKGREAFYDYLKRLHKEQSLTIVLVSHDMDEVAAFSDRIAVLSEGGIAIQGTPAEVFSNQEKLKNIGLGVPQIVNLVYKLRAKGFRIPPEICRLEDVRQAIYKLCQKG